MVPDREDAHKLFGAASSNSSSQDIAEKQNQDVSPSQVGQYHSSGIHKQAGRNSLQGIGRLGKEPVDVVPGEATPTRCSECNSRCGVSDYDRSVRLATKSRDIQHDSQHVWSNGLNPA